MRDQIHKRLVDEHVIMILSRFIRKELSSGQGMDLLGLKRRQFFEWVRRYRQSPDSFTMDYKRETRVGKIGKDVENSILTELAAEKQLIDDPTMPVRYYNYSYVRDQLKKTYSYKVSLPTIIARAKKTVSTFLNEKRRSMTMRFQRTMSGS